MSMPRLVRGEIRKLTTTRLPWWFLVISVVVAGLNAAIVAFATDADGSKAFVATTADQQSLMAFAGNAMLGTSLFGAVAVAREYGHNTVVPTFLTSPKRSRAVLAQLTAVLLAGALLALVSQALVIGGVALALPTTEYGFLLSAGDIIRLLAASTLAGAIGAVLGAGLGATIRNVGGAVTAAILVVFVIPPLVAQAVDDTASWIPTTLFAVLSGVSAEISIWAAVLAVIGWAVIPAAAGLVTTQQRDVV